MERVLCNKTNWLVRHGYNVTIVTTDQKGRPSFFDFDPAIRMVDLGVNYTDNYGKGILRKRVSFAIKQCQFRRRLSRFLRDNPADIVVTMFSPEVYWLSKLRDGSKKVAEIHFAKPFRLQQERRGLWWLSDWVRTRYDEKASRKYDRFVVLTNEDKALWGERSNIEVIYNSGPALQPPSEQTSHHAIAVGRLCHQKGFDMLIRTWQIVHRAHPEWTLDIFGSGEDHDKLAAQIAEARLQDVVILNPPTGDIMERYRESSLFVLSSRYEGFGMVLLEAMACGVPAVAMACKCGPRDIIDHEVNGLLVPDGDVEGLAAEVVRLIENPELRQKLACNARESIETRFSEEVIMQQWDKLFKEIA
jgi:glycosyltransferase involved in cell wall biosynthesis